ncbi:MAG TPA: GNAT family N-acetyltransferase [Mycobacteriales bacterium]|nr:GNAT family N-acetyltransferase [Mycobacteriales bacterium]
MTGLTIGRVADRVSAEDWHRVVAASHRADYVALPADPVEELLPLLGGSAAGERVELWLGRVDAEPVAAVDLRFPTHDNPDGATLELFVHPDRRRLGHGRDVLRHVLGRVSNAGRRKLFADVAETPATPAPGSRLAHRAGARPVLAEVRRMLDLTELSAERLAGLRERAAAAASGYTVVAWVDRAAGSDLEDLAKLKSRMSTDAPLGEMAWEPEAWDAARYRAGEDLAIAQGRRRLATAVRCEATGRLVGYTDIGINPRQPDVGYQWDTIVRAEHRGHRLGLLLKTANLQLLGREVPAARSLNTWNAASNTYMIEINDLLGFRPVDRWQTWELELPAGQ